MTCFVFWSKNYLPFLESLSLLDSMGYSFYFNFTITGLPKVFEVNLVDTEIAVETLKQLSRRYSPRHINWRYDPVLLSSITDRDFHLKNFEKLAAALQGSVERCYFSFVMQYGKVKRNFAQFESQQGISIVDPDISFRQDLAEELAGIASRYGITLYSCCGDILLSSRIQKAHCVDGALIEELFHPRHFTGQAKPTRLECGCTLSTDIGTYDTCPHGCIYCYANANKQVALASHQVHDPESAFLGYSRVQSEAWLEEIKKVETEAQDNRNPPQLSLL